MLLRASGDHDGGDYDPGAMVGDGDGGVADGALLIDYADAVLDTDPGRLTAARDGVCAVLGEAALVDAAAVVATFNAVDRVADATGTPLEDYKEEGTVDLRARLGIDDFVFDRGR